MATLEATAATTVSPAPASNHQGPFSKLADELIYEILLCLPHKDLQTLIRSGTISLKLPQIQSF